MADEMHARLSRTQGIFAFALEFYFRQKSQAKFTASLTTSGGWPLVTASQVKDSGVAPGRSQAGANALLIERDVQSNSRRKRKIATNIERKTCMNYWLGNSEPEDYSCWYLGGRKADWTGCAISRTR